MKSLQTIRKFRQTTFVPVLLLRRIMPGEVDADGADAMQNAFLGRLDQRLVHEGFARNVRTLVGEGTGRVNEVDYAGTVAAIRVDHVWVKAYVDMFPFRGARAGEPPRGDGLGDEIRRDPVGRTARGLVISMTRAELEAAVSARTPS